MASRSPSQPCILALEDGTIIRGRSFGATGTRHGEVVFNTSMTGYQEILTDPSYCGQIVTMTYPQMGNYGVNDGDLESQGPHVRGFAVKELAGRHSNHRATHSLQDYLQDQGVVGIAGVDTRALTRKLRVDGAMRGVISTELSYPRACVEAARETPGLIGADLVREVAPKGGYNWAEGLDGAFVARRGAATPRRSVVAIDCGMKRNILRHLVDLDAEVRVVPPTVPVEEVLALKPAGVFVSNGPGDPAAVTYAVDLLRRLVGRVPIFGICLGHQLLGLALGAKSFKLKFGHRGANQPVLNLTTERVEITSQNHGFAIDADSLQKAGGSPTHTNLNDQTLEGFVHRDMPILAVQYHPEASPGPHDAAYLFDCFASMMGCGRAPNGAEMAEAQAALQARQSGVSVAPVVRA